MKRLVSGASNETDLEVHTTALRLAVAWAGLYLLACVVLAWVGAHQVF